MPQYLVTVQHTLTLTTSVTVVVKNEEAAHDAVKFAIEGGSFGTIAWEVEDCTAKIDGWEEEDHEIDITSVEEDQ